jgi:hypothetical protein
VHHHDSSVIGGELLRGFLPTVIAARDELLVGRNGTFERGGHFWISESRITNYELGIPISEWVGGARGVVAR